MLDVYQGLCELVNFPDLYVVNMLILFRTLSMYVCELVNLVMFVRAFECCDM